VLKGEYPTSEGSDGIVGMGVGDIMQSQNQIYGHRQGQLVNGAAVKGKGKRVVELDLEFEDDDEDGDEEYEAGGLKVIPVVKAKPLPRRIPGAFGNRIASGNGAPVAKRSRV